MAIERITPGTAEWDAYYGDHIARYEFAVGKVNSSEPLNLLDAACGVGYGSYHLSKLENVQITAVDQSDEALSIALKQFSNNNIRFIKDDCHSLENAAGFGPFDAIVSFETLEHLPQPEKFLKSCLKNLKTDGKLIVSTPNQLVSSPGNNLNWEFHEKEYTPKELVSILTEAGFKKVQLFGQQFSFKGKLKNEIRGELNSLWSNPFVRFGRWIQRRTRGHAFKTVLREEMDDFEIVEFAPEDCERLQTKGPFVLIAIATK